jgi:hypothetical protein
VQARCLLGKHRVRAGGRKRDFAHALLEIEVGILYPIRLIWPERRVSQPPVEGCDEVQASLDNLAQSLERQGIFGRHRIDDADAPDMAEDGVRLHRQERSVKTRQLPHACSSIDARNDCAVR